MSAGSPYRGCQDAGTVTVEAAFGICSLVFVLVLALGAIGTVVTHLRCTDAAIEAARLAGRGDRGSAAEAIRRLAPERATSRIQVESRRVSVTVRARPLGGVLPRRWMSSSAYALLEPGVSPERGGDHT